MKICLRYISPAILLLLLAACESAGIGLPGRNQSDINAALDRLNVDLGEVVTTVPNFRISGWHAVNDRNLIVTAGMHNHYLLSLGIPCSELSFAFNIALDMRTSMLSRGDDVIVRSMHRPLERCQIQEITRLVDRTDSE